MDIFIIFSLLCPTDDCVSALSCPADFVLLHNLNMEII